MRATLALLLFALASRANATPLAISETDVTWEWSMVGGVRTELSVHFEDLASSTPGIGRIQLEISGRVKEPAFRRFHLESSFLSVYGNHGHSAVRFFDLDTEFVRGDGTSATFSPGLTWYGDPITYAWIDFAPDPSRRIEWHATVELAVYGVGADPIHLLFVNALQGSAPEWCTRFQRCRDRLREVDFLEITATPVVGAAMIAAVPEPGTAVLVAMGLGVMAMSRAARSTAVQPVQAVQLSLTPPPAQSAGRGSRDPVCEPTTYCSDGNAMGGSPNLYSVVPGDDAFLGPLTLTYDFDPHWEIVPLTEYYRVVDLRIYADAVYNRIVPEPGTGLLVIAGLLGLAGWRRMSA